LRERCEGLIFSVINVSRVPNEADIVLDNVQQVSQVLYRFPACDLREIYPTRYRDVFLE
jgi:hypothetical protein